MDQSSRALHWPAQRGYSKGSLSLGCTDGTINSKLGSSTSFPAKPLPRDHVPYSDDIGPDLISLPDGNDSIDKNGVAVFENQITDRWINAELHLPQGEELRSPKIIGRSKDTAGNVVGTYDDKPMLNPLTYDVEFSDGEVREYSATVIAENM